MTDVFALACSILLPEFTMDKIPDRASADLRAKQLREDQYIATDFDPWNDDHVGVVVPSPELRKPLQALLLALAQIEMAERSFGVDRSKAYDSLIEPLKDTKDAFIVLFNSL